jgi:CDP-diglyceride synthetase
MEPKKGWVTVAAGAILATTATLLYCFGPDVSYQAASGAIGGAVAILAGAFRR